MTLLEDKRIKSLCINKGMISPFTDHQVRVNEAGQKIVSYGLGSAGYDIRLDRHFKVCDQNRMDVLDVHDIDSTLFIDVEADSLIIPPHGFVLAQSMETFKMPPNVLGLAIGKSSWARCALVANLTPLEPGWYGTLTLELSNTAPLPIRVYAGEGICQILFFPTDGMPETSYKDRAGKYNGQTEPTLARL